MKEQKKDILIVKNSSLELIQSQFKAIFPFLSIEFYKNGIELNNKILTLEQLGTNKDPKSFIITGQMSVGEVEESFEKCFGIKIGIFRKLGQSSVETSFTSKWSLDRQNKVGGEIYFEHE